MMEIAQYDVVHRMMEVVELPLLLLLLPGRQGVVAPAVAANTSGLSDSRIGRLADFVCRRAVAGGADSVGRRR